VKITTALAALVLEDPVVSTAHDAPWAHREHGHDGSAAAGSRSERVPG
jgi:hypothetical protein